VFIGARSWLTNPKTHITNGFTTEALFQFSQDVDLGDLFEFVLDRFNQGRQLRDE
jgi:hypothetical protein